MDHIIVGNRKIPHCFTNKEKITLVCKLEKDYSVYSNGYVVQYVHDDDVFCTTRPIVETIEEKDDE